MTPPVDMNRSFDLDVAVIGGGGHVGLPLSILFADCGFTTSIIDVDPRRVDQIRSGSMPFMEDDAPAALTRTLASGKLTASTDVTDVGRARFVVCIIGTPVDE